MKKSILYLMCTLAVVTFFSCGSEQSGENTIPHTVPSSFFWVKQSSQEGDGTEITVLSTDDYNESFSLDTESTPSLFPEDIITLSSGMTAVLSFNPVTRDGVPGWSVFFYDDQGALFQQIGIQGSEYWELSGLREVDGELLVFGGSGSDYERSSEVIAPVLIRFDINGANAYYEIYPELSDYSTDNTEREWIRDIVMYNGTYYILSTRITSDSKYEIGVTVCDEDFSVLSRDFAGDEELLFLFGKILEINKDRLLFSCGAYETLNYGSACVGTFNLSKGGVVLSPFDSPAYLWNGPMVFNSGEVIVASESKLMFYNHMDFYNPSDPGEGDQHGDIREKFFYISSIPFDNEWSLDPNDTVITAVQTASINTYYVSGIVESEYGIPLINWVCLVDDEGSVLWHDQEMVRGWEKEFSFSEASIHRLMDGYSMGFSQQVAIKDPNTEPDETVEYSSPFFWWKEDLGSPGTYDITALNSDDHTELFTLTGNEDLGHIIPKDLVFLPSGDTVVLGENKQIGDSYFEQWSVNIYDISGNLDFHYFDIRDTYRWDLSGICLTKGELFVFGGDSISPDGNGETVYPAVIRLDTKGEGRSEILDIRGEDGLKIFASDPADEESEADEEIPPVSQERTCDIARYNDRYYILTNRYTEEAGYEMVVTVCDKEFNILSRKVVQEEDYEISALEILDINETRLLFSCSRSGSNGETHQGVGIHNFERQSTIVSILNSGEGVFALNDNDLMVAKRNFLIIYEYLDLYNSFDPGYQHGESLFYIYPYVSSLPPDTPASIGNWLFDPKQIRIQDFQPVSKNTYLVSGMNLMNEKPLLYWVCLIDNGGKIRWQDQVLERSMDNGSAWGSPEQLKEYFKIETSLTSMDTVGIGEP